MLVKNRLKVRAVFLVAALSLTACGQNASIAKKGGVASTSQIDKTKAPQASPTTPTVTPTQPVAPGGGTNPGPVTPVMPVTPPAHVTPPAPVTPHTPAPVTTPLPLQTPAVPTPPAPGPAGPVGPGGPGGTAGPAGPAGPGGQAGREGCGLVDMAPINVKGRSMEASEFNVAELPYQSTRAHRIEVLQIGQASPGKILNGTPYVQDSQVLFKFPMHLPPKESITKLYNAYIQLSLTKLSNDGHPRTEWLCFLDQRLCSGALYDEQDWQANINGKFWDHMNNDIRTSDLFVKQFIESPRNNVGTVQGLTLWTNASFALNLEDLIKGSNFHDVLSFLYDGVAANTPLEKNFRAIVADDTRVVEAWLVLEFQEDTCKAFDLQSVVPATPAGPAAPAPANPGTPAAPGAAPAPAAPGAGPGAPATPASTPSRVIHKRVVSPGSQ